MEKGQQKKIAAFNANHRHQQGPFSKWSAWPGASKKSRSLLTKPQERFKTPGKPPRENAPNHGTKVSEPSDRSVETEFSVRKREMGAGNFRKNGAPHKLVQSAMALQSTRGSKTAGAGGKTRMYRKKRRSLSTPQRIRERALNGCQVNPRSAKGPATKKK